MLNSGIWAFDLRYASDPDNQGLFFCHTSALLSDATNVDNMLYSVRDYNSSEEATVMRRVSTNQTTMANPP